MTFYTKPDMVYTDYLWTTYRGDDPHVTGEPDSTLLNRNEGYEVLYFINKYGDRNLFSQIRHYQKVEKMIREEVPSDIRKQIEIYKWIQNNWFNSTF